MDSQNPLGLYSPFTKEQVKAMNQMRFPGYGASGYGSHRIYSSEAEWDLALDSGLAGTKVNYARKLGDLTTHSLPMAGVRWLGNTLPEAPIQVKQTTGKKGESEVIGNHPLLSLLRRPNPYYAGSRLWKGFALSWILSGNVYLLKIRDNALRVRELWYVPHWLMVPRWPEVEGNTVFISHYDYYVNGQPIPVPVEDVIHFRDGEDPRNSRLGLSGVGAILRELYSDAEAANYSALLMGGAGVPPFIIEIDPALNVSASDLDQIADRAHRSTSGDKRGKPFVVSGGKVHQLGHSPKDMNLSELHDFPESRFCAVTGIPAVVMELASGMKNSIYNNVKQAEQRAYDSYLKPLHTYIAEELRHQLLLPDFEDDDESFEVSHDYSKVQALQEDDNEKAKRLSGVYESGGILRSEFRSGLGYGPSDDSKPDADKVFHDGRGPGAQAAEPEPTPNDTNKPPFKVPSQTKDADLTAEWLSEGDDTEEATPTEEDVSRAGEIAKASALLLLLFLGKRTWDVSRMQYAKPGGGYYTTMEIRAAWTPVILASRDRARELSTKLSEGNVSLKAWQYGMRDEIKAIHTLMAAVAQGGKDTLTDADLSRVGRIIQPQFDYLNKRAAKIASGDQALDGTLLNAAGLYPRAAQDTYFEVRRQRRVDDGAKVAERVRNIDESCPGCIETEGYWPIDEVPPIGSQECLNSCYCDIEYLDALPAGATFNTVYEDKPQIAAIIREELKRRQAIK